MNREEMANIILERLSRSQHASREAFKTAGRINSFYVDDVLPEDIAQRIYTAFPKKDELTYRNTIRERKYVSSQMDKFSSILEETIFAFQDQKIVRLISELTGIPELFPDEHLYAGGLSLMDRGCFLNPHLDNSHDKERQNYRVLNLLYYVSPDWEDANGGNLELWDDGLRASPRVIVSKFNRLAIMITNRSSWHSVNRVNVNRPRCCVSNYYFSPRPLEEQPYFHVTSFRGRPEEGIKDAVLKGDMVIRNGIRKIFKDGIVENPHVYKKKD